MNPSESRPEGADPAKAWLSALADGRADACDAALKAWSQDAEARRSWHAYQLIGDVLRSDDLAASAQHDEAFLHGLRQRLAKEPTILAPQAMAARPSAAVTGLAARHPSLRWSAAAAVAGVALVGGLAFTLQRAERESQVATASELAQRASSAMSQRSASATSADVRLTAAPSPSGVAAMASDPDAQQWYLLDESVVRDARLESYLRAHRGGAAVGARVEPVALGR